VNEPALEKTFLCLKKELWLITVTMIAEGDVLLYVLLKYAEGQQDTAL
jgi:hypothetical protein